LVARKLNPVHHLPTRRYVWDLNFGVIDTIYLLIMYKLCWPNGTVFNTYESRIDAELDQELFPPFEETVIVYEEPSPDTYPRCEIPPLFKARWELPDRILF